MKQKHFFHNSFGLTAFTGLLFFAGCSNIASNINTKTNTNAAAITQNTEANTDTVTVQNTNTQPTNTNTPLVDPDTLEYKTLTNTAYGFTVSYPTTELVCLNQLFCGEPEKQSKDFTLFSVSSFELSIIKNGTGLSGADVGKRYLDLNLQYEEGAKENYTDAKYSTFAGQKSFEFMAQKGLDEGRGTKIGGPHTENILLLDNENPKEGISGIVFKYPHKVIYFEKDGILYRIYFSLEDVVGKAVAEKFKFN